MPEHYYFQAPSFDINPDSETSPRLGSIFSNLDTLTSALNQDGHIAVPESLLNRSNILDFSETKERTRGVDVDFNISYMQSLVGSADVMYGRTCESNKAYLCEELETLEFTPSQEYVNDSILASQIVQTFLEQRMFRRKYVYMITGLKVATGFAMSSKHETSHNPSLKMSANAALAGVPVEGGPGLSMTVGISRNVDFGRTANKIVFAYRSVRVKRRTDGNFDLKLKKGGIYSVEDSTDEEDSEAEGKWELQPVKLEAMSNELTDWKQIYFEQ